MDSFPFVQFGLALGDEFGLGLLADEEYSQVTGDTTVGDLEQLILSACPLESQDDVWPRLQRIVARCFDLPVESVRREARLVGDLGGEY